MSTFREVGERDAIRKIMGVIRPSPDNSPLDDAAIVNTEGKLAICSDGLTFDRHMTPTMTYEQFGWMAGAVNFSDLASMGARPTGILASLMMPPDLDIDDICDIMDGIDRCAEFCDTYVIGGDTKEGTGSVVCTAIGNMEDRKPMTRHGANPGDMIAVTGELGSPAAGWHSMNNGLGLEEAEYSLNVPVPRVNEGMAMAGSGAVTSCMDLSDGLAEAAWAICNASHVGLEIRREFLPIGYGVEEVHESLGVPLDDLLLYWGGEYELVFTFRKDMIKQLYGNRVPFTIIGQVTNGDRPTVSDIDGTEVLRHGIY